MYQNVNYQGKLAQKQLYFGQDVMEYEQDVFTPYQNLLYKQLVFGYKAYSSEELQKMTQKELVDIKTKYAKAQRIINIYKQEKLTQYVGGFLSQLFPRSPFIKELNNFEPDKKFFCTLSFSELNISKQDIVSLFIEKNMLPKNFYAL
jgi:hypothetical protein